VTIQKAIRAMLIAQSYSYAGCYKLLFLPFANGISCHGVSVPTSL